MKFLITALTTATLLAAPAFADGHRIASADGATAYIISPADGATVSNPVTIVFGLSGMGIAPAGYEVDNTGHHHLLINTDIATVNLEESLPASDTLVHFGGGQTETTRELPTGTHTLQLLLGDYTHTPHMPPVMSEQITITVE